MQCHWVHRSNEVGVARSGWCRQPTGPKLKRMRPEKLNQFLARVDDYRLRGVSCARSELVARVHGEMLPLVSLRNRSSSQMGKSGRRVALDGRSRPRAVRRSTVTGLTPRISAVSCRESASFPEFFRLFSGGFMPPEYQLRGFESSYSTRRQIRNHLARVLPFPS